VGIPGRGPRVVSRNARRGRSPGRQRRLERRRLEREQQASPRALPGESLDDRIVCERCGLEQPFRSGDSSAGDPWGVAPCEGPLGLACSGERAVTLEAYDEELTDGASPKIRLM